MSKNNKYDSGEILVRRGRVDSVDLFEVKENELDTLEKGEQADIFLNFSIFLFSLAFSVALTLASATFEKTIYETLALIILVVGLILGLFLFILWRRSRVGIKKIVKRIRSRIPPEVLQIAKESETPNAIDQQLPNEVSTDSTQPTE